MPEFPKKPPTKLVFVDCETTGLDPDRHEIFEVALIRWDRDYQFTKKQPTWYTSGGVAQEERNRRDKERWEKERDDWDYTEELLYWLEPDHLDTADSGALRFNDYYKRAGVSKPKNVVKKRADAATLIARVTAGAHLVGFNPAFDARFLEAFLREHGQAPAWHYHLVDVEVMLATVLRVDPPWRSDDLLEKAKLPADKHKVTRGARRTVPEQERHTAMYDAKLTREAYHWCQNQVTGLYGAVTREELAK